ncbi:superoxide dismutase [Actinopolymorpha rutila]|uniref:Cu-Zn family superoxide dismutase n=1 Tax=Actinopolymorpha rutila TaxID=446787 RepID=A0A852ZFL5_9ACTN|nr:superoxide dismutase [Actinopolymorpha rutila]NYH90945.1 Cu-Zn family superoxide dismutase [Actinopolymorpha rutila]
MKRYAVTLSLIVAAVAMAATTTAVPSAAAAAAGATRISADPSAPAIARSVTGVTQTTRTTQVGRAALDRPVIAIGRFGPVDGGGNALTYDPALVPVGAQAAVAAYTWPFGTTTVLAVTGLVPRRTYGAHVHVNSCGSVPAAAGPHVQFVEDPVKPSVDPRYANPRNEIWLDFRTDANGVGYAVSTVYWPITAKDAAAVVIHEHGTSRGHGHAGMAGARLACLTVPFDQAR